MLKNTQHIGYAAFIACVMLRTTTAFAVTAGAKPLAAPATEPSIQIVMSGQNDGAIRLEARLAPLGKILKEITAKTGAVIHYSVLPEAPVTATCAGATVSEIMDCLVAKQVGLVANKPEPGKPAEFWVLSSSVGSCQSFVSSEPIRTLPLTNNPELSDISLLKLQKSDVLLEKFRQAKTSEEKLQALSDLSSGGVIEDPNVRKVLNDASMNQEASIRTQAVITSAALDKENGSEILANALKDQDASVRMTAVDMAHGEKKILEQALTDSDASVRDFASAKLAEIKQRQERLQQ
jgi:hypothetical protein